MRLRETRADGAPVYLGHAFKRSGHFLFRSLVAAPLWRRVLSPGILLASAAIRFYQRHLSPRKGFRCAHGVLHEGPGCSEAVRRIILRRGVLGAWPFVKRRFAACKAAAATLCERAAASSKKAKQLRAAAIAGVALAGAMNMPAAAQERKDKPETCWGHCAREVRDEVVGEVTNQVVETAADAACQCGGDALSGIDCSPF